MLHSNPIRKVGNKYHVDFRPDGKHGVRRRKRCDSFGEAERYVNYWLQKVEQKEWNKGQKQDKRRFSTLVDIWYTLHGYSLQGGVRRKKTLLRVAKVLGNPLARNFTTKSFTKYRRIRTRESEAKKHNLKAVSAKTVNNDLIYVKAMFNELIRLGEWTLKNPLDGLRPLKYIQPEMGFLSRKQIKRLFEELKKSKNPDTYFVAGICIRTGARWREAEGLHSRHLKYEKPRKICFERTKGNKSRTVPIDKDFFESIPKKDGPLFTSCFGAFRKAIERAGIDLPKGQMTHALRHTFASHFMKNKGKIEVLKQILGHVSIVDTMKYTHFSPKHLKAAIKKNPMNHLGFNNKQ